MKRKLPKLLFSMVFIFFVLQSESYAQENDFSLVVVPVKSSMISEATLKRQTQLEVQGLEALDNAALESIYQEIPDRSVDEIQSRAIMYETQKACRGVARLFRFAIPGINPETNYAIWDFGDGSPRHREDILGYVGHAEAIHNYLVPGIYTITIEFFKNSSQPSGEEAKQMKVIVDVCTPPVPPQFSVNPNIHKVRR